MSVRVLIALLLALSPLGRAEAQQAPWHAAVAAPRPGLPAVAVDLGYPGPYVPAINSPIALTATASGVRFDGYIGFHFVFRGSRTSDTPVVARATLRPSQSWSFRTFANLRRWGSPDNRAPRELVIEWRDLSMKTIAQQSAGVPPWRMFFEDLLPLNVVEDGRSRLSGQAGLPALHGGDAYLVRADALSDRAQWYAGFSSVVVPLESWLDLPKRVREAVFGSGMEIVLVGLPRANQTLDEIDRAILPVTFTQQPGSYDAPWPYRGSRKMPVATPMSWSAKPGASAIGGPQCPYITRTAAAAWIADGAALDWPLPSMIASANRQWLEIFHIEEKPGIRMYRAASIVALALAICVVAWLVIRRRPVVALAAASVLIAGAVVAERSLIRPAAGIIRRTFREPAAPGIVHHLDAEFIYGPTPVANPQLPPEEARTRISGDDGAGGDTEVRATGTPPSMGLMTRDFPWDSVRRWTYRREIDPSVTNPDRIHVAEFGDFHGSMFIRREAAQRGRDFRITAEYRRRANGQIVCLVALPPISDRQVTQISAGNSAMGGVIDLNWDGGHVSLEPRKKDIYATPTAVIPPEVVRAIAAHGGLVEVTITPGEKDNSGMFFRIWIQVQEKRS